MGLAATLAAAFLLLAACASASPPSTVTPVPPTAAPTEVPTPTPTPLPSATPEPTEEPSPTPAATRPPQAAPPPATNSASIRMVPGIQFDKTTLTVAAGPAITINVVNQDAAVAHNFAVYRDAAGTSPVAGAGANACTGPCSFTLTFAAEPGTYLFRCDLHPADMRGQLIVR